jgi:Xaa-Pro aminopeptidase
MKNFAVYKQRRLALIERIKKEHSGKHGVCLLLADFEDERHRFRQESSFYYFTGIEESGVALTIDFDGKTTLHIPHYDGQRSQWVSSAIQPDAASCQKLGVDAIVFCGEPIKGYAAPLLASEGQYKALIALMADVCAQGGVIFTLVPAHQRANVMQKIVLNQFKIFAPVLANSFIDISALVGRMRRVKSKDEIELLYKAIELTVVAHQGAACALEPGKKELEIQAGIDYVFNEAGACPAFPSIVAAGMHGTVLHYTPSHYQCKKDELAVVDIGAEFQYYCADITRTYPVSGTFNKRQREIYQMVLDAQRHVMQKARPGMWLFNKNEPEKSLHHLAVAFFEKYKMQQHFAHTIGHFLGIDVHDVGDVAEPLQEGDVITIEPGLYIPQEGIGVRIEDDFWIVRDGCVCLSEDLPRDIESIQEMAQSSLEDMYEDDDEYDGEEH